MKISKKPHYSRLIEEILNHEKSNAPDLEKRKSESAGDLLADILMSIFDNKNEISNFTKQNFSFDKLGDCYSLSINRDFFCTGFDVSLFLESLDYNFENENELWRLINDVFGENGRYKNQDSFDVFIERSKLYGFDFIKCSVINNSNNSPCLKLEFKILKELPKLKIPKELSPKFVYCPDDFEKPLPESTDFKVCNVFATVTEFLRNCLGDAK